MSCRRKVWLVSDCSFLLDRLLPYEKADDTSDDSDATDMNDDLPVASIACNRSRFVCCIVVLLIRRTQVRELTIDLICSIICLQKENTCYAPNRKAASFARKICFRCHANCRVQGKSNTTWFNLFNEINCVLMKSLHSNLLLQSASSMATGSRSKVMASLKRSRPRKFLVLIYFTNSKLQTWRLIIIRWIVARTTKPVARRPKGAAVTATEQPAVASSTRVEVDTRRGNDLLTLSQAPHSLPEDIFNDSLTGDGWVGVIWFDWLFNYAFSNWYLVMVKSWEFSTLFSRDVLQCASTT